MGWQKNGFRREVVGSAFCRNAILLLIFFWADMALALIQIDLSGWWIGTGSESGDFLEIQQTGDNVIFLDIFGREFISGVISNDSVFLFAGNDTLIFTYSNDTLSGYTPQGETISLVRSPAGPLWRAVKCASITVDGDTGDWQEEYLAEDDPDADAVGGINTELDKIYCSHDQTYLYIRLDLIGTPTFPHSGHNNDRYSLQMRNGIKSFEVGCWNAYTIILYVFENNSNTYSEAYYLDPAGIIGNAIELRIPLLLLGNPQRLDISAQSEYYHNDNEAGFYDQIAFLANTVECLCGDADNSGEVSLADAISLINWIFLNGSPPQDIWQGNVDCSDRTNLVDLVYLIQYLFKGGPAPCYYCP